ncbi:tyrosine-type recombinase/integrase [Sinorhizobium meliloti]|uniref:tyrosine-type recombinase/integrase n=1 Tax=Rhizobium meliloti TaxID=382 RepID=UPI0012948D8D|nr:site-specific integrase [Sinorhizobium meliloti]MDW9491737.1 tyrosine-type recombinase/integrase [Sinorhizobium meliloti]MQV03003.1 tyrosine-type recombinase/integrase [Sinorhizobium meliloti]
MAIKKAKTLTQEQFDQLLTFVSHQRHAFRDKVMLMLSFKCGLRACEIARLRWRDITDALGNVLPTGATIELGHHITKGKKPDTKVYMHNQLHDALVALKKLKNPLADDHLMYATERGVRFMSVNNVTVYLYRLYIRAGMFGCSSHSGRRTFITTLARNCNNHGASIKDVQNLARHADLRTTEKYIDLSPSAINLALHA